MKKPWRERPVFKDRRDPYRDLFDERGVSPVIAVILMVAITVVLAATLYVMVIYLFDLPPPPPKGNMAFEEIDQQNGIYRGSLVYIEREVPYSDTSITITDISTGHSVAMDPVSDGGVASCGEGELNITYEDLNNNNKLDSGDVFIVYNGEEGDFIVLTYTKDSGGQICQVTLN